MSSRLDRWLGNQTESREADTLREIAEHPTPVTWWRGGVQIGTLTVRAVAGGARVAYPRSSDGSESVVASVTIVAPAGTVLHAEDRLQAEGSVVYRLTSVLPDQRWRTEAAAEVETQ